MLRPAAPQPEESQASARCPGAPARRGRPLTAGSAGTPRAPRRPAAAPRGAAAPGPARRRAAAPAPAAPPGAPAAPPRPHGWSRRSASPPSAACGSAPLPPSPRPARPGPAAPPGAAPPGSATAPRLPAEVLPELLGQRLLQPLPLHHRRRAGALRRGGGAAAAAAARHVPASAPLRARRGGGNAGRGLTDGPLATPPKGRPAVFTKTTGAAPPFPPTPAPPGSQGTVSRQAAGAPRCGLRRLPRSLSGGAASSGLRQ